MLNQQAFFHLIEGEQVAGSVTQIWYSLRLSEEDYQLVVRMLQELVNAVSLDELTGGAMKVDQRQFHRLCEVWQTWLQLSNRVTGWVTEIRREGFWNLGAQIGMESYLEEIPQEHKNSASEWLRAGFCHQRKRVKVSLERILLSQAQTTKPDVT